MTWLQLDNSLMRNAVARDRYRSVAGQSCRRDVWRIIPSRYPQINLFEQVSDPKDWEVLYAVESLTNPRLRDQVGDIHLVAPEDRVYGEARLGLWPPLHIFQWMDAAGDLIEISGCTTVALIGVFVSRNPLTIKRDFCGIQNKGYYPANARYWCAIGPNQFTRFA